MNISMNYEDETILKVGAVLNGFTKMIPTELRTEISAAVQVLIEAYAKREDSRKDYDFYTSMVETYMFDYHRKSPEAFILFIRHVTNNNIFITYTDVPAFRDVVKMYGQLLRRARCIKFDVIDSYIMGVLEA